MAKRRRDGTWEEPADLRRIRREFTEAKARAKFQLVYGRPPHSDEELERWAEFYTLEVYNGGGNSA